ncbi:MAG: glycosyltransferase [Gammaproteobacteria bacterium]|nr:glycosyltransferase [Gammaproteobacteria bacterium]
MSRPDLAILVATSGHSGVDTLFRNLAAEIHGRGHALQVLRVDGHGPAWESVLPAHLIVRLGAAHVDTSLLPLVRYLRRERPRALLTDKDRVNRMAVIARRLAGVDTRLVIRIGTTFSRNLEGRRRLHRLGQHLSARHLYPRADVIVVPSRGAAADLVATASIPASKVKALPSPVITARVLAQAREMPAHPWLRDKTRPVFLGAGELCARKDFATLIRAFAALRRRREARLIILGEGRRRGELEALVRELGVADDVDLPGFTANPYGFMANADVFVLSSRWEGLGNVLVEALALGMRCVATDCPSGPREVLEDGRYGALVPVGDVDALARSMAAALDEHHDTGQAAAATRRYGVAAATDGYLQVLGLAPAGGP